MKCHYEVLGVSMNSSVEDIKKAYRRLALEWHPDKNLHRTEEATETFHLIQQAYEILIDPQERAWYDRNKDKILKHDADYVDTSLDVFQYFNTSCFRGYEDDDKSFYMVYGDVFEKIAAEDQPYLDDDVAVPKFGDSKSPYKEVVYKFYAYWQNYCTSKSYSWVDKYDLGEARKNGYGRQVLRMMERENKKLRDSQKKARNEEVRQLVAFVKKRDKRVELYKKYLEQETAEKAKRTKDLRRKQMAERKKDLESFKEPDWTSMSVLEKNLTEMEEHLDSQFGAESSTEKDDEDCSDVDSDLYCVVCDKGFRSAKALANHENSKKHKEKVTALRAYIVKEDKEERSSSCETSLADFMETDEETETRENVKTSSKKKKRKRKRKKAKVQFIDVKETDQDGPSPQGVTMRHEFVPDVTTDAGTDRNLEPMDCENRDKKPQGMEKSQWFASGNDVEKELLNYISNVNFYGAPTFVSQEKADDHEDSILSSGFEKLRISNENKTKPSRLSAEGSVSCAKCGCWFSSRNKLFYHLKETGHSMALPDKDGMKSKRKKKKVT